MDEIEHTITELHLQIEDTLANADRLLAERTRERDSAAKERDELKRRNDDLAAAFSEGSVGGVISLLAGMMIGAVMSSAITYLVLK